MNNNTLQELYISRWEPFCDVCLQATELSEKLGKELRSLEEVEEQADSG